MTKTSSTEKLNDSKSTGDTQALPDADTLQRKIIYTAEVNLVVEQFGDIPEKVDELAKQFDGYVARSDVSGAPGRPRSGRWTIRVPVKHYEEFLLAAQKLGEVRSVGTNSEDVSEEYYDVEARIRNKKKSEERLVKLLEDATGKLDDVLKVERELTRVREEIERMEGRLRVLENLTSLTTVELQVDEIKDYVPEEAASYGTRVRRSFESSIAALVSFVQACSLALVFVAPWLVVVLVLVIVLVVFVRIVRRRRR